MNITPDAKMQADDATLVSEFWGKKSPKSTNRKTWTTHPIVRAHVNRRVSGDPAIDALSYVSKTYFPRKLKRALSLGCGFGSLERAIIASDLAEHIDAYDLSEEAINQARKSIEGHNQPERFNYSVQDLNQLELEEKTYGAIFAWASVHHVFALEQLFSECRRALHPSGLLVINEYVGPSRFQTTPAVTSLINRIRTALPPRYMRDLYRDDGSLMQEWRPPNIGWFEKYDPSESVRSAEIINTLELYFNIVEIKPYGGAILHHLLNGIVGNFDETDENDVVLLNTIILFETILEESGVVPSDFAVIVAKPK